MINENAAANVCITAVGCRTNQEEMAALSAILSSKGYRLVDNVSEASIVIVNTCSVTSNAESKTRRLINSINAQAPNSSIVVTGCLAQQSPYEMLEMKGVKWVVGNGWKERIDEIIEFAQGGVYLTSLEGNAGNPLEICRIIPQPGKCSMLRTRYSVKIQEGCDFRCTYCIVPQLRGPSRSASFDKIIETCRCAVEKGYKEIILTGTHIGQFNDKGRRLIELLDVLTEIEGDFRIRLSSLDPCDCSDELIRRIGMGGKICDHLHVSLQSCSKNVLEAMNRPVLKTLDCIERLQKFRNMFPMAGLGADLIVGFPGETDRMFEETCLAVQKMGLSYAHIFRYSPRRGTIAADSLDQVKGAIKKKRSNLLKEVVKRSRSLFINRLKGSIQRIIVESASPLRGLTSNFVHVEIPDSTCDHNIWLDVTITAGSEGRYCCARPILRKVA